MPSKRTIEEKIAAARADLSQQEARVKRLLQEQKAQGRKERAHRLCKRGALVEKLHPRLAKLTDEQFGLFVDLVLKDDLAKSVLDEIMPTESGDADGETDAAGDNTEGNPETGNDEPKDGDDGDAESDPTPKPENDDDGEQDGDNDEPKDGDNGAVETAETTEEPHDPPAPRHAPQPHGGGTGGHAHNGGRQQHHGNYPHHANRLASGYGGGNAYGGNGTTRTG